MQSTTLLAAKLGADFPRLKFAPSTECKWAPKEKIVYFYPEAEPASLLHEVSHAQLGHYDYLKDIQLIEMERDAWFHCKTVLAGKYEVMVDDNFIEDALDTYRNWLHARSSCPGCSAVGIQTKKYQYKCLVCEARWTVNDARGCALRRHALQIAKNTG